jgi:hypothetical protein
VLYSALHLKPGVKEWFMFWLEREHPELLGPYRKLYAKGTYAPVEYRKWLGARIKPFLEKHDLQRGREDPSTGGVYSSATPVAASSAAAIATRRASRNGIMAPRGPVSFAAQGVAFAPDAAQPSSVGPARATAGNRGLRATALGRGAPRRTADADADACTGASDDDATLF